MGRLDTEELQSNVKLHITHIVALQQPAEATAQLAVGVGAQLRELEALGPQDAYLILRGVQTRQVPFVLPQESPDFIEAVNQARALITS